MNKLESVFEKELLDELYAQSKHATAKAGDVILSIGQNIRVMPIVTKGNVKVLREDNNGHELLLYYINPNESCVMTFTCCMEQHTSEIKAVAEDDVEMLLVPVTVMDKWMMTYPTWKSFVMRNIRERFNELLEAVDLLAFEQLDDRLIAYLKNKAETTGSTLLNLSHQDIANELASSRVVISRLLKKLENQKKLLLYRNQIKLLNEL
ncbi:MAG: Crp/Fnr family transcriptional regulator [Chitinophagales bacterium]|nr:Crp/Fnr family transcriptional regulator [Chitinophagaceae bacterium]MCB9065842.1 Crp/Fnr family transcriptional regulator [Chitinophagales bacterium]